MASNNIDKGDIELIIEVNKKAIEIGSENAEQNEKILELLNKIQDEQDDVHTKLDNLDKALFQIKVLFVGGVISLAIQIIQIFTK